MANVNVTQGVDSKHRRTLLCRLVSRQDFDSAIKTASVLARFGIYVIVFSDQSLMHRWLEKISLEPSITVKLVSEVPHV